MNLRGMLIPGLVWMGLVLSSGWSAAQDVAADSGSPAAPAGELLPSPDELRERTGEAASQVEQKVKELAEEVDRNERAREFSAGILQPIYTLAEMAAGTLFYWSAFTLMAMGVVSYALQLVIGKLLLLSRLKLNLKEVAGDAVGLMTSLVGLVLTTQAATENSEFTRSPFAVLSATIIGSLVGIYLFRWGYDQELRAATAPPVKK